MLQTRNGKRSAKAAIKIAVDMANRGLIRQTAVKRVTPEQIDQMLHPQFDKAVEDAARKEGVCSVVASTHHLVPQLVRSILMLT